MFVRFIHISVYLSNIIFHCWVVIHCLNMAQSFNSLFCWWIFELFPVWSLHKRFHYKNVYLSLFVNMFLFFLDKFLGRSPQELDLPGPSPQGRGAKTMERKLYHNKAAPPMETRRSRKAGEHLTLETRAAFQKGDFSSPVPTSSGGELQPCPVFPGRGAVSPLPAAPSGFRAAHCSSLHLQLAEDSTRLRPARTPPCSAAVQSPSFRCLNMPCSC